MRVFVSPAVGDVVPFDRHLQRSRAQHGLPLLLSGGVPVLAGPSQLSALREAIKRAIDIVGSAAALVAFGPALLILAIAIKFSGPGPVLFRQWRVGRHGVPFQIYKFRTLRHDATDVSGVSQVAENDPRVTPLGALMRAKSLDELPQLINVLRGDMSLIGPRPHPIGMMAGGKPYERLVPYYDMRHAVRPGLSGWAQVNGLRGPTADAKSARARIDHDIAYIQNQSIGLDLGIIVLTIKNEFLTGSGI